MARPASEPPGAGALRLLFGCALLALALMGGQRFVAGVMVAPAYGPVRGVGSDAAGLEQARQALATAYRLGGDPRDLGNHAYLGLRIAATTGGTADPVAIAELERALADAPAEPENWLRLALALDDGSEAIDAYFLVVRRFGWLDDHRAARIALAWRHWADLPPAERVATAVAMRELFRAQPQHAMTLARSHGTLDLYRLVLAPEPKQRARFESLLSRSSGG